MKNKILLMTLLITLGFNTIQCIDSKSSDKKIKKEDMNFNKLTEEEARVIIHKGTEMPYSGEYYNFNENGIYVCKRCDAELYRSTDKFDAHCGWPSFDDEIPGAVKKQTDADGHRTEILCNNCNAHLGHVFHGEGFTEKNTRHCVNSISMKFVPAGQESVLKKAYYAGGCFWGIETLFQQLEGVKETTVGYMGGTLEEPSYEDVCYHNSGHTEAVEVVYDENIISYEDLTKYFFEIHDPTQLNRQGPDIGDQYRSAVFYNDDNERQTAEKLVDILKTKEFDVVTELVPIVKFWNAEDYHQDYYNKTGKKPYCHFYVKRF